LRSKNSLIQTIGRAARHVHGQVILYADEITDSMRNAMDETDRRRQIQTRYNQQHGIVPTSIIKEIRDLTDRVKVVAEQKAEYAVGKEIPKDELFRLIAELEKQMKAAAAQLEFEKAALLRDQILELRRGLEDESLPEWERVRRAATPARRR
jgi:excinuclease ABC subunit B